MAIKGLELRLERLERRWRDQAAGLNRQSAMMLEHTPERQAEVLHILCACGVFALPIDPHDPDAHPLQAAGRTVLQARGVLDDDGYLVPGVMADALIA